MTIYYFVREQMVMPISGLKYFYRDIMRYFELNFLCRPFSVPCENEIFHLKVALRNQANLNFPVMKVALE
jgi:hypothetical protein